MNPIRPMYKGSYGYPVLIKVSPEHSLLGDPDSTKRIEVLEEILKNKRNCQSL